MGHRDLHQINGVDLCVETFGRPTDPSLLLLGGAVSSMDWWEDEFCERLAAGGLQVIRYDQRDTGESTSSPAGAPTYGGDDLVADAIALVDRFAGGRAHLGGISMGGAISYDLAIEHPDKVATLTLFSTTAMAPDDFGGPSLPPPTQAMQDHFADPPAQPDWGDREAVIDYSLDDLRLFAGPYGLEDEEHTRALLGRVHDRTRDMAASMTNHWILEGGAGPLRGRLGEITAPTLVVHGTDDPLFPLPHGEALAREIPGARLLPLEGVGHEVPPPRTWDLVVPAVLEHTTG